MNQFVHVPTSVDTQHSMHACLSNLAKNRQTDRQTGANAFTSFFVGGNTNNMYVIVYNVSVLMLTTELTERVIFCQVLCVTKEGRPSDMPAPSMPVISYNSLTVNWTSPRVPNGRLLNYSLVRVERAPAAASVVTNVSATSQTSSYSFTLTGA